MKFLRKRREKLWFLIYMFCAVTYLTWRIFFTIPFGHGAVSVTAGLLLFAVETLGMAGAVIHYANLFSARTYPLPEIDESEYPDVDVFIPTYSEEPKLLYKTLNGCKHMRYPDRRKVHIYLCDDNRRPEMRRLAEQMGVCYLDRPDHKGAKAGNLNHALAHSSSPLIVTFDADMIPKSDFLLKTIPYFADADKRNSGQRTEPRIELGFLQSPQCFYTPDLFQFNLFSEERIPNEQDYFYRDIQVSRTRTNSVIYGGSNTVLRREALEAVGGFYTEAITEDFATGILIQRAGYVTLGIAEPLASGMSASDLQGLIQQRTRWARGVIATGRKMHIFRCRELSSVQKLNYWASVWYWYAPVKRMIYIMSPILYAVFGFMVFECTLPQVLLFWLPMYVSGSISLRLMSNQIRNTKWTNIYETVLAPYMLLPVLLESVGITLKKFKVTAKEEQRNQKGQNPVYTIPFVIWILLSAAGIGRCVWMMFDSGSFGPVVVLFWLLNNLYLMVMALFFVDGRVPYRKAERVAVEVEAELKNGRGTVRGVTRDISETGVSVLLEKPWYFDPDEPAEILLDSGAYRVRMLVRLVYINAQGDCWNYSMRIWDYLESYDDYLQMLYDRIPVLPQEIKRGSGSFEDLKLNTAKRAAAPFYQKRRYPRVFLETEVACGGTKSGKVTLRDFNYRYAAIVSEEHPKELALRLPAGITIPCVYETELLQGVWLYRVKDMSALFSDHARYEKLVEWLAQRQREAIRQEAARTRGREKPAEFDEKDLLDK